jgi:hypothetical protein
MRRTPDRRKNGTAAPPVSLWAEGRLLDHARPILDKATRVLRDR